jgi:DNA-binding NtrC family response regulator
MMEGPETPKQRGFLHDGPNKFTHRVLVVDDEKLIRWALGKALGALGCEVVEAGDAASAVEALTRDGSFTAAVLDLKLPDSADLSLLTKMRDLLPSARIVLMTAVGTDETTAEALALGAFRVVSKPFDFKQLAAMVAAPPSPPADPR